MHECGAVHAALAKNIIHGWLAFSSSSPEPERCVRRLGRAAHSGGAVVTDRRELGMKYLIVARVPEGVQLAKSWFRSVDEQCADKLVPLDSAGPNTDCQFDAVILDAALTEAEREASLEDLGPDSLCPPIIALPIFYDDTPTSLHSRFRQPGKSDSSPFDENGRDKDVQRVVRWILWHDELEVPKAGGGMNGHG